MNTKIKNMIAALLVLLIVLAALSGCGAVETQQSSETVNTTSQTEVGTDQTEMTAELPETTAPAGIVLTDMADRTVELDNPAEKIVSLTAADVEIIYALGAGSSLVGRGEYCNYPAEVLEVPAVQSGNETNIEQIIALQPDVVIMSTMAQSKEQIEALESAGIPVAVSDAQSIDGIYEAIEMIGQICSQEANAQDLIAKMKADLTAIATKAQAAAAGQTRTIYFEVSPLEWGLWAAGSNTFMDEATQLLGLKNAFADVDQWGEISQEQVIERNPDYIVTIAMYFGEGPLPVDEIMSRDGWQNIKAVADKRVFNADSDELARPGPRLVDGIASLYDFVYPE